MAKPRLLSPEAARTVRTMKAEGKTGPEIRAALGITSQALRSAMLYREGRTSPGPEVKPVAIKAWPDDVNFTPDEVEVRAWE
jgi:hypothetical protein